MAFLEKRRASRGLEKTPSETIGKVDRTVDCRLAGPVGGKLLRGDGDDLRRQHLATGLRGQTVAAQDSGNKRRIVVQRGVHGACGACPPGPFVRDFLAVFRVVFRGPAVEVRPPNHARVLHPEPVEDTLLHQIRKRLSGSFFDDQLHQLNAFTRINVPRTRLELDVQLPVVVDPSPVQKAGGMGQEHPRREPLPAGIGGEIRKIRILRKRLSKLPADRRVGVDEGFVPPLHHPGCECGFGERCRIENGVSAEWRLRAHVRVAECTGRNDLAVIDDGHGKTRNIRGRHEAVNVTVEVRNARRGATDVRRGEEHHDQLAHHCRMIRPILGLSIHKERVMSKTFGLAILVAFCFSLVLQAQQGTTVRGRVTIASDGSPLPGVTVSIDELHLSTVTDADGRYQIPVTSGRAGQTVKVSAALQGFQTRTATATLGAAEVTVDFALRVSFGQEITVGSRAVNAEAEKAVPVDIITHAQIESAPSTETNQIIQKVAPSFNFPRPTLSDGTDSVRPATLRGLGPDQVLVMVNGKRRHVAALVNVNGTVGRGSAGVDLHAIPASAIDSVEILRDGAAAQYGSDAIAGVLNLVLKSDAQPLKLEVKGGATTHSDGQTVDTNLSGGWNVGRGALFANVEARARI